MSDKHHAHNDEPWNYKNATPTVTGGITTRLPYNAGTTVSPSTHPDINFGTARFQTPLIQHQHQQQQQQHVNSPAVPNATFSHMATTGVTTQPTVAFAHHHAHHGAPSIAASNVPVFPAVTAAATSVLTPNPFAAATTAAAAQVAGGPTTRPYALQQFFHAMNNVAAAASLAANPNINTPLSLNATPSGHIIAAAAAATVQSPATISGHTLTGNRIPAVELPSPSSTSSAGASMSGQTGGSVCGAASSGAITNTITENVLNVISGITQNATPARNMSLGIKVAPDEDKLRRVHQMVEASVGDHAKQQIVQILDCISTLKPVEKLLLYLRLPGAAPETDPLRQPQNPLGTRSEINHTINWVRSHLEQDPHVSIPKQDVYNDYISYCERLDIKPLSTADFGKVMKQVFPGIRPRRLGTRGHSRYCYAAMRKTTKLPTPQLPQLGTESAKAAAQLTGNEKLATHDNNADVFLEESTETWSVIKTWAENLLQLKVDNAKELADRIKTGNMPTNLVNLGAGGSITHKKFGNRETKEKRALTDMGPLKKRRKKKRKGSSSSESSFNSQPPLKQINSDKEAVQQPTTSIRPFCTPTKNVHSASNVDENSLNLIKVKEEVMDSPNFQHVQQLTPPLRQNATMAEEYLHQQQQQQQQMWPINLAPEQRSVLTRAQTNLSSTTNLRGGNCGAAAKNLVPKIMELAAANAERESLECNFHPAAAFVTTIKEEEIDEYNPSNILCKKVRKAQQTKGFWQQTPGPGTTTSATSATDLTPIVVTSPSTPTSTTLSSHVVPVITTSAPTPTPPETVISTAATITETVATTNVPSPVSNLLMGPPAAASSTSPFAASDHSGTLTPTPKVASKNSQQLRARRMHLMAAAAAAASANEANLNSDVLFGLPRERVISICNMDKHELDDYFINDEDDNSNDQETELLQYFQTGDAEEKLNSLDAGKQRNLTAAAALLANNQTNIAEQTENQNQNALQSMSSMSMSTLNTNITKTKPTTMSVTTTVTTTMPMTTTTTTSTSTSTSLRTGINFAENAATNLLATTMTLSTPTKTPMETNSTSMSAVGSASASLALLSQKHQHHRQRHNQHQQQQQHLHTQQQEQPQQHPQPMMHNIIAPKRKIPPSSITTKQCTFAPISPNINSSSSNGPSNGIGSAPATSSNGTAGGGFFASPGITPTRLRPKPALLGKQQSLDNDLTSGLSFPASAINTMHDPMIGASRRRRNYVNVTSASAPPSPSILHQQQQQQQQHSQYLNMQPFQQTANQWHSLLSSIAQPTNPGFLNDQNSLDLDLFGAANGNNGTHPGTNYCNNVDASGALPFEDYVAETQRSQSVPLSQLQRIHSPPVNIMMKQCQRSNVDYGAENSLICSENSSSQQSNPISTAMNAGIIKLEDTTAADALAVADSATLLDGVDVNEILSSPDFVQNFTSIAQQHGNVGNSINAATTTCSSAGSSSGYSSVTCPTFSSGNNGNNNIMSRSVPSTPLPHHHQNLFGQSITNFYNQRRRSGIINDELQLSPNNGFLGNSMNKFSITSTNNNNSNNHNNNNNNNNGNGNGIGNISFANTFGSRSIYDMSKSMPTTPITTPSFRYSPEFNRDFLINGNTIDDTISFGGVGSDSLMGNSTIVAGNSGGINAVDDDSVNLVGNLNADALLTSEDVSVPGADDVLLGNL